MSQQPHQSPSLDRDLVLHLIDEHLRAHLPRLERWWDYYRNDSIPTPVPGSGGAEEAGSDGGRAYHLAQERGLPARLRSGWRCGGRRGPGDTPREIVIENDIAWRIHTLVDFMVGKPFALQSLAADPRQAQRIEALLHAVFEANGGVAFFQDLVLLGSIYGYIDVLLRLDPALHQASAPGTPDRPIPSSSAGPDAANSSPSATRQSGSAGAGLLNPTQPDPAAAACFGLEIIEAPRAVAVLNPDDYRRLDGFVLHYRKVLNELSFDGGAPGGRGEYGGGGFLARLRRRVLGAAACDAQRPAIEYTEVWTDRAVATYRGLRQARRDARAATLIEQSLNPLGRVPVVHIQNLPLPFFYEGLSEVEPLVPLQDELNTRLSDRANRVTFQCFKMYLGKGIDNFLEQPVGPGQMWATDNHDAAIEEFGGDAASPSEEAHIAEIREAMDKTSGVTAVAAGLLRDKVGNLTSENALRIVMTGLLSRTEKKRVTYGAGIARLCELILHAADVFGVLPNRPEDRRVRLDWPSPLPDSLSQRLADAKLKLELGVPRRQVLAELGYAAE